MSASQADGCSFCAIVAGDDPDVVVYRSAEVAGFLDRRPLFHGHCLFVPRRHIQTLDELPGELVLPLITAVQTAMVALQRELAAEGVFVAANNRVSQSVPHLHIHVVPRRRGDGLRGFFWPRHPYEDEAQMRAVRDRVRTAINEVAGQR